jgi:hypothetical protein
MMRSLTLLTVLAASAAAFGAHAQAVVPGPAQSVVMQGDVPTRCKMSPPQLIGSATNATFTPNQSGGQFDVTNMVDTLASKTLATHGVLELPIVCTGAHSLTVSSIHGGLINANATGQAGGFATRADYALSATWAGITKQVQTTGASTTLDLSSGAPSSGSLSIGFDLPGGAGPLQAGAYNDEIVVQLNAAS